MASTALNFDRHQFFARPVPVTTTYTPNGWVSNGISFDDYAGMGLTKRKHICGAAERRLETPEWALSDEKLREVLVVYLEARARVRGQGTQQDRLAHASKRLTEIARTLTGTVTNMCSRYVALKNAPDSDASALKKLGEEIENIDTQIVMANNTAAIVVGVVHFYYRCQMSSVEVAGQLGLKPPHVRQILWRLRRCWKEMQNPKYFSRARFPNK
jgi:hypothetical protein